MRHIMSDASVGIPMQEPGQEFTAVRLPIKIWGFDAAGKVFEQPAFTVHVSPLRARIGGIKREVNVGSSLAVGNGDAKAASKICAVTTGADGLREVDIELVKPVKNIWASPNSEPKVENPAPAEAAAADAQNVKDESAEPSSPSFNRVPNALPSDSRPEPTGEATEKIRDILFGSKTKEFERRFVSLEDTIARDFANILDKVERRLTTLESALKKDNETLESKLQVAIDELRNGKVDRAMLAGLLDEVVKQITQENLYDNSAAAALVASNLNIRPSAGASARRQEADANDINTCQTPLNAPAAQAQLTNQAITE